MIEFECNNCIHFSTCEIRDGEDCEYYHGQCFDCRSKNACKYEHLFSYCSEWKLEETPEGWNVWEGEY